MLAFGAAPTSSRDIGAVARAGSTAVRTAVKAVSSAGTESQFSNVASKAIQ